MFFSLWQRIRCSKRLSIPFVAEARQRVGWRGPDYFNMAILRSLNVLLSLSMSGCFCTKAAQYHLRTISILIHVRFLKASNMRMRRLVANLNLVRVTPGEEIKLHSTSASRGSFPSTNEHFILASSPQAPKSLDGEFNGRSPVPLGFDLLVT